MSDPNEYSNNNGGKIQQFEKNNYFYGKLMSVRDFKSEQEYVDSKRHLLNRLIFKPGIACGLDYRPGQDYRQQGQGGEPDKIKVYQDVDKKIKIEITAGGAAIDSKGNEIIVPDNSIKVVHKESGGDYVPLTNDDVNGTLYLYLKYKQCLSELVPAISDVSSCEEECCPNRIIEDFLVIAFTTPPANDPPPCPDFYETPDSEIVLENIRDWTDERLRQECPVPQDPMVFLAAVDKDLNVIPGETVKYRTYVYNNQLLGELIDCMANEISKFKIEPGICECIYEERPGTFEPKKTWAWTFKNPFGRIPIIDVYAKLTTGTTKQKVQPGRWLKISDELDIQVEEEGQVIIKNPKGRKEREFKVVMMGQPSITKIKNERRK